MTARRDSNRRRAAALLAIGCAWAGAAAPTRGAAAPTRGAEGGAGAEELELGGDVTALVARLRAAPAAELGAVREADPAPTARAAATLADAKAAVAGCATSEGFYAGDDYRQYWTRDVGYSLDVLLTLGYASTVEAHLRSILSRVKDSGAVPAMVQTAAGFAKSLDPRLALRALRYRGPYVLDHLTEYASNFHAGEADNPVILVTSVLAFERATGRHTLTRDYRETLERVLASVGGMRDQNGMIRGGGWLDAMANFRDAYSLTNQVWLFKMYRELGESEGMDRTRGALEPFWDARQGFYVDRLGSDRFDALGNVMLLEEGLAPGGRVSSILEAFGKARTRYGTLNLFPAYAASECSQYPGQYQNATIWPFIEYRLARVYRKYGMIDEVRRIRARFEERAGTNEWYSPADGKPGGSKTQLWTACAYIGVSELAAEPRVGAAEPRVGAAETGR